MGCWGGENMAEIDVCALSDLPSPGHGGTSFLVAGEVSDGATPFFRSMLPPGKTRVAVFRAENDAGVFACEDRCPHADSGLASGMIRDGVLTCSAHGFGFDLATGSCMVRGPKPLVRYPVRVVNGRVLVEVW
jgi:nitrite reductase/ring-hydroxylating ferredoxin subunit